ncbi:hypothetical protein DIS24_g6906 [Lasiodiplodia hormozganensis]|uniref:Uncharacterized protein n=1 Tax=Lasiodiplodia hormozganensis TaxID=869390 RepID=A0AA39YF99_9PEZI|nr:hypothetical protein DIS24_g6906 [Lasiodiplodia hormozganensis]
MYSIESMEPTEDVAYIHTFADLSSLSRDARLALCSPKHVVQLKSLAPEVFEYVMPANVFKAFSPLVFQQAFQIPGEDHEVRRSVLMLAPSGTDPAAIEYICDWMVSTCNQADPFRLSVKGNFFAWVELLKAALLLQVHAAETVIWPRLAFFITEEPLEFQHLDTIMKNFSMNSKIVKHLLHNVSYRRIAGDITPSCEFFIQSNEFFQNLLGQVAYQQQQSGAMAMGNVRNFNRWNSQNAAYRRQRFEEQQLQQHDQPAFRYAQHHSNKNRRHNGNGYGHGNNRHNGVGGKQKRENMEDWARRTAAGATWDDSPAAHQGGAYDVRVLNPGEATASGLIA